MSTQAGSTGRAIQHRPTCPTLPDRLTEATVADAGTGHDKIVTTCFDCVETTTQSLDEFGEAS
jgi:hypothetical protein